MDMVFDILKQLGADETLWIQLGIIVVMLVVSKFLFLTHLQTVIEKREEKTVGLEGTADKQFDEVNKLSDEYKNKIQSANKEVRSKVENEKANLAKELEAKYRTEEKSVNDYIDESRKLSQAKIAEQKDKVLSEADDLALNLIQKITKG